MHELENLANSLGVLAPLFASGDAGKMIPAAIMVAVAGFLYVKLQAAYKERKATEKDNRATAVQIKNADDSLSVEKEHESVEDEIEELIKGVKDHDDSIKG